MRVREEMGASLCRAFKVSLRDFVRTAVMGKKKMP